jgi:hypothetical protein
MLKNFLQKKKSKNNTALFTARDLPVILVAPYGISSMGDHCVGCRVSRHSGTAVKYPQYIKVTNRHKEM